MNIFIAKTRWDILVEDMDLKVLVEMSSMPTVNDPLHKIILCGRRYIHRTCEELDKGSIIVKRLLMSGRQVNDFSSVNKTGTITLMEECLSHFRRKSPWTTMAIYWDGWYAR